MTWHFEATGRRAAIHAALRRHAHHRWRAMAVEERGLIRRVIAHAVQHWPAGTPCIVIGSGHVEAQSFTLLVVVQTATAPLGAAEDDGPDPRDSNSAEGDE